MNVYLINCMSSRTLNGSIRIVVLSIDEVFYLSPWIFGCMCYIHDLGPQVQKLDVLIMKCIFLGYSSSQKESKCFVPSPGKWYIMKDVTFHGECLFFQEFSLGGRIVVMMRSIPTYWRSGL